MFLLHRSPRDAAIHSLNSSLLEGRFAPPHRRRKVRWAPFPPSGENCARSLAPPLPKRPAALGPLWVPFVGPRAAAHERGKRNPRQTAGISAKSKNYSSMSITTLFPRCGQPHESSAFAGTLFIKMLRAAEPPFRQGFLLRTKRLYAPYGAPHLRSGPEGGRTAPWQKEIPAKRRGFLKGVNYSSMSITTPEPTVRPPSRMAKRRPFSMAMGVISSTFMSTLSPGMHISVPSGRVMMPVTSVVRK